MNCFAFFFQSFIKISSNLFSDGSILTNWLFRDSSLSPILYLNYIFRLLFGAVLHFFQTILCVVMHYNITLKATCINSHYCVLFYWVLMFRLTLLDIILLRLSLEVYTIIQGSCGRSPETCILCKAISLCRCAAELKRHLLLFEVHIL